MKVAVTLSMALLVPGISAQVIDQNQPLPSVGMAAFHQTDLAQSFQQSADNIVGAGIYLFDLGGGATGQVTITLWTALPNAPGAAMLASGSATGGPTGWLDAFWSPVAITSGASYFLQFTSTNINMAIYGDTENPYPNGQTYANPGYQGFPNFDYTFRTYADGAFETVPEPATMTLLATGLAGMAAARRRRRAATS